MSRGRRYEEPKLNMKKVFAVIIAIIVIIMFIFIIKGILDKDEEQGKISSETYFASYKDNKWGVINSKGEDVITPTYQEMIIIPNQKKDVFLCTYDVNYDTGEYKTKVFNKNNEEILTGYDKIEAIQNYDENNNIWYESNVLKIEKGGKYGLIDLNGKEILPCEYEEITVIANIQNAIKIKKDGKYGVVDTEGNEILKIDYQNIETLGKDNKSGYIVQSVEGKYGIMNYSNSLVVDVQYDKIDKVYGNDLYVVEKEGKQILVNKEQEEVLNNDTYTQITAILKTRDTGVIFEKDGKYGVMNLAGEKVIDNTYEELKEAKADILIAKQNGKYGIIDLQNNQKVEFKYNSITYNQEADIYIAEDENFNNDLLDNTFTVRQTGILTDLNTGKGYIELRNDDGYKYYNFKFEEQNEKDIYNQNTLFLSKKDGKYGFIDKDGNVVVDYIYDDATKQNEYGFAGIKKDGKWGSIDSKGNVVIEPTYNLDEYIKIDFIGKWHFGKDTNMNYYNQD